MDILILAHFVTEFAPEGTSRFVYLAYLLAQRHRVELITSDFDHWEKAPRMYPASPANPKLTLLPEKPYPTNMCLQRFFGHAGFARQVAAYLQTREVPDVIYCAVPSLDVGTVAADYAKAHGVRLVLDIQDLWPEAFCMVLPAKKLAARLFAPMTKQANRIYAAADVLCGVSETYCRRGGTVNPKARQVPAFLGTKLSNFDTYAAAHLAPGKEGVLTLGYCGTLGHSYDLPCIFRAMAQCRDVSMELRILGSGPQEAKWKELADRLQINAHFYGRVDYPQMCGLLAGCDVALNPIMPGAAQSVINKHGDYAAAGLPVVSTQQSPEYKALLAEYDCGISCPCGDDRAVAQALRCLAKDQDLRTRLGRGSRRLARERFDREYAYQALITALEGEEASLCPQP